ncbi:MAG: hypothetical protein R6U44_05880 [Archaeoglobaceae archaeon]
MRSAVIVVLVFSISVLILFSSTETITLFSGSHHISDITSSGNDISCTSCHSRIQIELSESQIHEGFDCVDCHRLEKTSSGEAIEYAVHNDSGWFSGNQSHAAYTPRCLDCHGENGKLIGNKFAPPSPAFNQTDYGSDYSAHKPFVEFASSSNNSVGANEACIACHTDFSIENEFSRPEYFEFSVKEDSNGWYIVPNEYGPVNTTIVTKSSSGAKHQFKARVKCENCHQDVWRSINHPEENEYGSTRASHVCWQWNDSECGTSCYQVNRGDPMHNISEIGGTGGYDNITDYCTYSCHKPRVNLNRITNIPPIFESSVHAAYRISCYQCHNSTVYEDSVWNKPRADWDTPGFGRDLSSSEIDHSGHEEIDDEVLSLPLFTHAETCISCKRGSCTSCHDDDCVSGNCELNYPQYKTWTEPNNTMYHNNDSRYI